MAQDEQDQTPQTVRTTQIDPEWQVDLNAPVERLVTDPNMMPPRISPVRHNEVPNHDFTDPRFAPDNDLAQFVYQNEGRLENLGARAWHSTTTGDLSGMGQSVLDFVVGGTAKLIGNELYDYSAQPVIPDRGAQLMDDMYAAGRRSPIAGPMDPLDVDLTVYSHRFGDARFEIGAQQLDNIRYNPTNGNLESQDSYAGVARFSWQLGGSNSGGGRNDR